MLIVIDIGNTQLSAGLFQGSRLVWRASCDSRRLLAGVRARRRLARMDRVLAAARHRAGRRGVRGAALASVVPGLTRPVACALRAQLHARPYVVTHAALSGVRLGVPHVREVGADRIVNAGCAYHYIQGACVVVDMGTATTLDCVDAGGTYRGGVILPGIDLSRIALAQRTARLPRVSFAKPRRAIGSTTHRAIRAGLYFGTIGMLKESLRRCVRELGGRPTVLVTGGYGRVFAGRLGFGERFVPDLTLDGLRLIWERQGRTRRD